MRNWMGYLAVSLSLLAAAPGCKKPKPPEGEVKKETLAAESPVPAPDGIVAEGVIKSPDAILGSLKTISPLVPDKIAPVIADVLHVGKDVGNQVDGSKPSHFVIVRTPTGTAFVLAAPLKDATKANEALAKLPFAKSEEKTLELTIYEGTGTPKQQVIGVRRSWLLAASSVEALKSLSPYVTRTLPTQAMPTEDIAVKIPQAAVRSTVHDALKQLLDNNAARRKENLARAKEAGATGPKGTPVGALDAISEYSARQNERFVTWLADGGDARVTLTTTGGAFSLRGEMAIPDPGSSTGKTLASWPLGDAAAILALPAGSLIAFAGRASDAQRTEASTDIAEMLAATFPDDIGAIEKTKIAMFLSAWDKSRGESTSGALVYDGPTKLGIVARLAAKDPVALGKLMKDAFAQVFALKGVSAGLVKEGIGAPTFSTDKVAGIDVNVLTLKLPHKAGEKAKPGEPESAEVVWGPSGTDVAIAAGVGARDLLTKLVEAKGPTSLEAYADLGKQIKGLGGTLAGGAVAIPSRLIPLASGAPVGTPTPPTDPVVIAIGKNASGPYLSLDLSRQAVELAVRFAMGNVLGGGKGGGGGLGGGGLGGFGGGGGGGGGGGAGAMPKRPSPFLGPK